MAARWNVGEYHVPQVFPTYRLRGTAVSEFDAIDEQLTYLRAGLDGLFTDQADIGVLARADFSLPVEPVLTVRKAP